MSSSRTGEARSTDIGDLPESWSLARLGDVFKVQQGKALSPSARTGQSLRPFLRTANVLWGRLDLRTVDRMHFTTEEAQRLSLSAGDLLVCEGGEIGRTAMWRGEIQGCSFQNHIHRLRSIRDDVTPMFIAYWMQAAFLHLNVYGGVGNRTTIPNLSGARLKQLSVPLPPVSEQRAIADILDSIQASIEVQENVMATLRQLKAATMARLFREGLRGEPLKQTEIGEIPENWQLASLGQLCIPPHGFIQTGPFGSQLHASDYIPEGVPIVNPTHIDGERIRHARIPMVSREDADRLHRHKLGSGDILFSRRGDVGRHAHVFQEEEGWLCGTGCLVIRLSRERIYPLYLSYFLSTPFAQEYLRGKAAGTIMPNINTRILASVPTAVPPYEEQLEIAELLRRFDGKIRNATARLNGLRGLFSSMLGLLMTGQIRLPPYGLGFGKHVSDRSADGGDNDATESEVTRRLEGFTEHLALRFAPERVILFGRHADGSPKAFGEVGLLVEMEFEGLARDQAARMAQEIPHEFSLDLVVRRPEDIARSVQIGDAFIRGILERGRVLYCRPGGTPDRPATVPRKAEPTRRGRASEEMIERIVRQIVEAVDPEQIVLFGSAARGEMGPDSDLDFLVVKSCTNRREVAQTIYRNLRGIGVPKDIVVVTPEDVERDRDTIGYIIRPALREGRVVYVA